MKGFAEKRKELSQTIALLIGSIKTEKGCQRCDFCRSMEDENRLVLLEEWDARENSGIQGPVPYLSPEVSSKFHMINAGFAAIVDWKGEHHYTTTPGI